MGIICLPGILSCPELCSEENQQLGKLRLNLSWNEEIGRNSACNIDITVTLSVYLLNLGQNNLCWMLSISQPKSVGRALDGSSKCSLLALFFRSQNASGADCLLMSPWINSAGRKENYVETVTRGPLASSFQKDGARETDQSCARAVWWMYLTVFILTQQNQYRLRLLLAKLTLLKSVVIYSKSQTGASREGCEGKNVSDFIICNRHRG